MLVITLWLPQLKLLLKAQQGSLSSFGWEMIVSDGAFGVPRFQAASKVWFLVNMDLLNIWFGLCSQLGQIPFSGIFYGVFSWVPQTNPNEALETYLPNKIDVVWMSDPWRILYLHDLRMELTYPSKQSQNFSCSLAHHLWTDCEVPLQIWGEIVPKSIKLKTVWPRFGQYCQWYFFHGPKDISK